jgi:hypothetical protein
VAEAGMASIPLVNPSEPIHATAWRSSFNSSVFR